MRAPTFPKYLPSTVDDPKALPNTSSQLPSACRTDNHAIRPGGMREAIEQIYTFR